MSGHRFKTDKIYRSLQHGETIIKELHSQFKEGRNCDLEIRLDKKRLYVHKCLIDIFFIKAGAELEDDRFFLDLTRYSQPVVEALVGLVYTGNLRCSLDQVENVYKAALELGCMEAVTGCQTYLRDNVAPSLRTAVSSRDSSSSPVNSRNPFTAPATDPLIPEVDPYVIVKTEPDDECDGSNNAGSVETVEGVNTRVRKCDYRSTYLVPVSTSNLSSGVPSYRYTMDSVAEDENAYFNVSYAEPHPALPAPQCNRSSKKKQADLYSKQSESLHDQKKTTAGKRKGRSQKMLVHTDSNTSLLEQFSEDSDDKVVSASVNTEGENHTQKTHATACENTVEGLITGNKKGTDKCNPTVLEKYLANVYAAMKTEKEVIDTGVGSSCAEDRIEAEKNEQMFNLGLAKKSDIKTNTGDESTEKSGKRRLRNRKKVDYSSIEKDDVDESSDYDPQDDLRPKKRFKSHNASKGRNLKIDSASLVTVGAQKKSDQEPRNLPNESYYLTEKKTCSTTIAVRQDQISNDVMNKTEAEETVYFPPAGSVPEGVNSQYAQGTYLKVKYVTETIKSADGNVTVISKRVPVRPRQFGLDERLKNRPAVYVCHPTAPVVKPVVRKRQNIICLKRN